MFKRKYKKSEWFKGLLEAEELYEQGFEFSYKAAWIVWFGSEDHSVGIKCDKSPRCDGVLDYVEYRMENKEIFQEAPDEQL